MWPGVIPCGALCAAHTMAPEAPSSGAWLTLGAGAAAARSLARLTRAVHTPCAPLPCPLRSRATSCRAAWRAGPPAAGRGPRTVACWPCASRARPPRVAALALRWAQRRVWGGVRMLPRAHVVLAWWVCAACCGGLCLACHKRHAPPPQGCAATLHVEVVAVHTSPSMAIAHARGQAAAAGKSSATTSDRGGHPHEACAGGAACQGADGQQQDQERGPACPAQHARPGRGRAAGSGRDAAAHVLRHGGSGCAHGAAGLGGAAPVGVYGAYESWQTPTGPLM